NLKSYPKKTNNWSLPQTSGQSPIKNSDICGTKRIMAKKDPKERKKLIRKLRNKYRLVIINDITFDERFSAFLTPLNVIAGFALLFAIIAGMVVSLILFTPLKEYIPGYSDTNMRLNALNAALKADSLEKAQD